MPRLMTKSREKKSGWRKNFRKHCTHARSVITAVTNMKSPTTATSSELSITQLGESLLRAASTIYDPAVFGDKEQIYLLYSLDGEAG